MKKIILINLILLSTGFLYAHEKDMMNKVPRDSKVNLEKNDSSSPVVVEGVKNRGELDSWIENYVESNYPGYNIGDREVDLSSKKSIIETVYLKNEQGNVIEVCFDITDYRKKFNELHKKEIIKISRDLRKQVISRATWVFGKKFIDRVRLEKEDDTRVLMFDVSAHINEYRKTHEINLKEIAPGMISVQK